jgi:ribonuclease HI
LFTGHFVKARTLCIAAHLTVKEGEAFGLLQAIKWVGELGLNNVIFNLDAKSVVDSFNF